MPTKMLHITGYISEVKMNTEQRRVATYLSNQIKYKWRNDLETENGHMVEIDLIRHNILRLMNLYRPFNPRTVTENLVFSNQLKVLDELITRNIVILDDFNLDLNKETNETYNKKGYLTDIKD
jgi:hypothetical protein